MTTNLITILGLPFDLYIYIDEQKAQRAEREHGTYDALDDKYIELQQLCIQYPKLDVFYTPFINPNTLIEGDQKQEEAILLIRISIFEPAFLRYQREASQTKTIQWEGWEVDVLEWLERKNFNDIWEVHNQYYDKTFVQHFDQKSAAA